MHVFGFAQALHTMAGGDEKIFKLLLRQVRCEGRKCIVQLGDNAAHVGPSIGNEIWNILLS